MFKEFCLRHIPRISLFFLSLLPVQLSTAADVQSAKPEKQEITDQNCSVDELPSLHNARTSSDSSLLTMTCSSHKKEDSKLVKEEIAEVSDIDCHFVEVQILKKTKQGIRDPELALGFLDAEDLDWRIKTGELGNPCSWLIEDFLSEAKVKEVPFISAQTKKLASGLRQKCQANKPIEEVIAALREFINHFSPEYLEHTYCDSSAMSSAEAAAGEKQKKLFVCMKKACAKQEKKAALLKCHELENAFTDKTCQLEVQTWNKTFHRLAPVEWQGVSIFPGMCREKELDRLSCKNGNWSLRREIVDKDRSVLDCTNGPLPETIEYSQQVVALEKDCQFIE